MVKWKNTRRNKKHYQEVSKEIYKFIKAIKDYELIENIKIAVCISGG